MLHTPVKGISPYVFENMVDGVLLLNRSGIVKYMNPSAQDMLSIDDTNLNESFPGKWLLRRDVRNDDFCQLIFDTLFNKQQLLTKKVCFYNEKGEKHILQVKSTYWDVPDNESQSGVLLIIQNITFEERLKKEKADSTFMLSLLLVTIIFWVLFCTTLEYFKVDIPLNYLTYIQLSLGLVLAVLIFRRTDFKLSDVGLSVRNIRKPILVNIGISVFVSLFLVWAKYISIKYNFEIFPEDQPFWIFRFTTARMIYPLSVILQEFLSQGVIHECLLRILNGRFAHIFAYLLTAVFFAALHFHRGFEFMSGSFFLVLIIGIIYRRQRTIWGLCISHYTIAMVYFFLGWV